LFFFNKIAKRKKIYSHFLKMLTTVEQTSLDETRQRIKELDVAIGKCDEIKKTWWTIKMDHLKSLLQVYDTRLLNIDQEVVEYKLKLVESINLKKSLVSKQIMEYNGQCLHLTATRTLPFCSMCGEELKK